VEDNGYAESTASGWSVAGEQIKRAAGFGIPAYQVDGNDFFAVHDVAGEVIERARKGGGPSLVHVKLTRYFGHFEGDAMTYRGPDEVETARRERDPLNIFRKRVVEAGLLDGRQLDEIDDTSHGQIDAATDRAKVAAMPALDKLLTDVYVTY